jgi:xanthine dehydrogenase YagR molybdenum-binding subunit
MFSMVGHQPATRQTIRLSAAKDGKLIAIDHQSVGPTSMTDDYIEYAANASRFMWGANGGISTGHKIVRVNRNTPTAMRAPHEAIGHVALECAMDELACKTGVDPVELRLCNDTMTIPIRVGHFPLVPSANVSCKAPSDSDGPEESLSRPRCATRTGGT